MAKHLEYGIQGEQLATERLIREGYRIVKRNWKHKHLEVDIIAYDGAVLVFVEVKTRRSLAFGEPSEFVDIHKQRKLIRAADIYLGGCEHIGDIRFDVVSVYLSDIAEITIVKDAFWSN